MNPFNKQWADRVLFYSITTFIFAQTVFAQNTSWDIATYDQQSYKKVTLVHLDDDTLYVKATANTYPINIDSIKYIRKGGKTFAGVGLFLGMALGGFIGGRIGANSKKDEGTFGELGGAIIGFSAGLIGGGISGALIGRQFDGEAYYNFSKITPEERSLVLDRLLKND